MRTTEKYLEKLFDLGEHLIAAAIIVLIGYLIYRIVAKMFDKFIEKTQYDEIVLRFIRTMIKLSFGIIIGIMALGELGVNVTTLIAIFTTAAAAIALAFKDTLAELVDGVKIMLSRPFVKGDLIEVDNVTGRIQEISLFYTFLLTVDNKKIVIPNSVMANSRLINYSSEDFRRVDLAFDVDYDCDIEYVKKLISDVATSNPLCEKSIPPFVRLTEYKDSSITFTLRVWTRTENFEEFKFNIVEDMKKTFDEHHINIPYPQLDVHMIQEKSS
ncbi:mechanosensitive ion channel domain-containing protein [Kandleria sp.]|uniref:mechanosensitive ion channel family protein n=1 Tax=Kandleria sp. TaxID=2774291 RepID=UPI001B44B05A|nr:mechanosensitive ion channel domain-containing protein [Kandleria sp.]MBP3276050.1 mechanosensitive ion channel [Kandleria sp.]